MFSRHRIVLLSLVVLACLRPLSAQQKGQYVPGQYGLNAGAIPDPGFTYANLTLNYSAGQLNNSNGNALPNITGTYSFWVNENLFYYVPTHKFLGAYYFPYVVLPLLGPSTVRDTAGTVVDYFGSVTSYVEPGWFRTTLFGVQLVHRRQSAHRPRGIGFDL